MAEKERHLAGIVPIAGQKRTDYVFPWHDCLMPLSKDYYAIQRAVYECAVVGCDVIWIISDTEFQPLIREIVGSWILDPLLMNKKNRFKESFEHRRIPIYYLPIHPKDRERRDCLPWSILYGANVANDVAKKISYRVQTDKFWVAFPHGVYDPEQLREFREGKIHNPLLTNKNIVLTSNGNSVINGTHLGFSLTKAQVKSVTKKFRDLEVGERYLEGGKLKKRPKKESFTGRFFSLDKMFGDLYSSDSYEDKEVNQFYQIDKFSGYRELMGSDLSLEKPEAITRFKRRKREWRKMFQD